MITLSKPDPKLRLAPNPRGKNQISAWRKDSRALRDFEEWAIANQNGQCAFCMFDVGDIGNRRPKDLDHFAPQGETLYPQWRFEPLNLLICCSSCNRQIKRDYDPVIVAAPSYSNCKFSLVHPYLDAVDKHLIGTYTGGSQRVAVPQGRTDKGLNTIVEFKLAEPSYIVAINRQALLKSLDDWRSRLPRSRRTLLRNALAELSGRRKY